MRASGALPMQCRFTWARRLSAEVESTREMHGKSSTYQPDGVGAGPKVCFCKALPLLRVVHHADACSGLLGHRMANLQRPQRQAGRCACMGVIPKAKPTLKQGRATGAWGHHSGLSKQGRRREEPEPEA